MFFKLKNDDPYMNKYDSYIIVIPIMQTVHAVHNIIQMYMVV